MTSIKRPKFMIIDGNALIHRSFHALPPLTTKSGEMVNAAYGYTAVLLKAIKEFQPDYIALTLDRREKTFRHEAYKEYKATRVAAPDELYAQIPRVKEVTQALNIPIYEKAGFEADDIIGTLANKVDGKIDKVIVTGDLDTLQLINDHTKVYTMKRGLTDSMIYDEKMVKERYGLLPEQMIDFKALRGDPSDNIPGVKGIGEITAIELLKNFKTLDGVYKNIESKKIKDRIRGLLVEHKDMAYMSKDLATIKCDAQIDFDLEDARFKCFDQEKVAKLFSELEFKSLLPRLQNLAIKNETKKQPEEIADKYQRNLEKFNYNLVDNDKQFEQFLSKLKKRQEFVFDTETANFDAVTADLLGISFSWKAGEAYYVNFSSTGTKQKNILNKPSLFDAIEKKNFHEEWLDKLKPIFENSKIKKYGHNIKYDLEVMASYGIRVKGVAGDSMVASYLLNPGSRQHGLDALTFTEFSHQKITTEDLLGKGREKITFGQIPLEKIYNYSCEDADFTFRLVKLLFPRLKKEGLVRLFHEIEVPLIKVLVIMEVNGIKIDTKFLDKISKTTQENIKKLEKKICKLGNCEFNINSTQQLREVLFEKLELPTMGITKTKTGLSTGADELEKLKDLHPIIRLIMEYRELGKLYNTYIDALPQLVNKKTGRLHTSFNQSVTATGRLSSTEPNLQNIPIRTELGKEIRQAFIADKGFKLLSLDYSQIELRLAAHMSGDKKMIKAFLDGEDIHRSTAAEINQIAPEEVTPELRRQAKAVNFGILYGQGPHGLSQGADIPYVRAKEFIDNYFSAYKGVKKYIEKTIESARDNGYTETLYNRKRYLPEINSSVMQVRKSAERMAINTPLQGTAADIIKIAMIRVEELIEKKYADSVKMLLQVHDELVFEAEEKIVEKVAAEIKDIMENVIKLKVPIEVDAKVGDNWGEMKKI